MTPKKIVVHTDVFLDHLAGERSPSVLRLAMRRCLCYTTVFQAMELFSLARTERELREVENTMAAMKLLGVNPKNARLYGKLLAARQRNSLHEGMAGAWNILIAGLCIESRLPLLTERKREFAGIKDLQIISPRMIVKDTV